MEPQFALFRALSDPSRRAIFEHLSEGELSVKELTLNFNLSQPAVSQHLAVLSEASLVSGRKEGRRTFYQATPEGLLPLVDWLSRYRAFWTERMFALDDVLKEMGDEPCE